MQTIQHTIRRYRTLRTSRIMALPIVILMPHSACNCKCIMCDIWKGNKNLKQLDERDIRSVLGALKKYGTKQVVMSGGEAILNPNFFRFCELLKNEQIKVTLLTSGLTLKRNAGNLVKWVNDVIVSLDGDEKTHDFIRQIPGAFLKVKEGVAEVKRLNHRFRITARTVIHRLNFRCWASIIDSAKAIGLDQISFLPADVSSEAFNRAEAWEPVRQQELLLSKDDLCEMEEIIDQINLDYSKEFQSGFIAESPDKIRKIYSYYAAYHSLNPFPYKKCNAPWVSTVIEADGTVRPCFFHPSIGNIRENDLDSILNGESAIRFRKSLDMELNSICMKCVCSLNLSPWMNPAAGGSNHSRL